MSTLQVADGIHRVDGTRVGNAYVVEVDHGLVVVDSGIQGNATRVLRTVAQLGRRPEEVRVLVLTHWHPDHVGSAAAIKLRTGAEVAIHELDSPVAASWDLPAKGRRAMRLIIRLLGVRPVTADRLLREGDEVDGLRVLHVPGHTAGSIALVRDGVILTGDALLGDRHGHVLPPDPSLALDPDAAAVSADRIRGLSPHLVLPGHGSPAHP